MKSKGYYPCRGSTTRSRSDPTAALWRSFDTSGERLKDIKRPPSQSCPEPAQPPWLLSSSSHDAPRWRLLLLLLWFRCLWSRACVSAPGGGRRYCNTKHGFAPLPLERQQCVTLDPTIQHYFLETSILPIFNFLF